MALPHLTVLRPCLTVGLLAGACLLLVSPWTGQAQPAPAAVTAPAVAAGPSGCSVSEFRALALDTHDPRLREERALKWLDAHLRDCNLAQLRAIGSNRGAWMGVAETATLAGRIDSAIERRIQDNPDEVKALFGPAPAPPESVQSTASGETPIAPRSRIVGPGTPAIAGGAGPTAVPVPVPVPVPVAAAAATPGSAGPTPTAPPAPPRFADEDRKLIRDYYETSVVAGECPPNLQARDGVCRSANPIRLWRMNELLPVTAVTQDLPSNLALPILRTPNVRVVRLAVDILLIDPERRVIDAIVDLGSPRAASARSGRPG